jgi:hypothetical protein
VKAVATTLSDCHGNMVVRQQVASLIHNKLNLASSVSIFRYSSSSINPVYTRHSDSSSLGFSLSSHPQSYIGLVFTSRFID